MTSKISYIKLIRKDIRHRAWLFVLICVALFLAMPLYAMLRLDSFLTDAVKISGITPEILEQTAGFFPGLINGRNAFFTFAVLSVSPVLCALSGFSWIHSREKEDFFLSLPVKRIQWFVSACISGILIFTIPYVVCTALVLAAGQIQGIMTAELAKHCILTAVCCLAGFLILYSVCVMACMLTGKTVTTLLTALTVAVYPYLMCFLPGTLQGQFYQSYYADPSSGFWEHAAAYLSPLSLYEKLTLEFYGGFPAARLIAAVVLSAVLLTAAVFLYRRYPSEAAGNALAFPLTAPVFKILICIPLSLCAGFFVQNYTGVSGNGWTIVLNLSAVLLLCGIVDFIYEPDLKLLLKRWKSSLACVLSVALILSVLIFDLTGYDTRIPKKNSLASIGFRPDSFSYYFNHTGCIEDTSGPLPYGIFTENTDPLYRLAQTGIANLENDTASQVSEQSTEDETSSEMIRTAFAYRLKSGRTIFRQYEVDYNSVLDTLTELCKDENFRRDLFPVFQLDRSLINSVSVQNLYGSHYDSNLPASEIHGLLDALEKDTLQADIRKMDKADPLGELTVWFPASSFTSSNPWDPVIQEDKDTSQMIGNSFYIYPGFDHTLDYLEQCGYPLPVSIDPAGISYLTLTFCEESVQDGTIGKIRSLLSEPSETFASRDGTNTLTIGDKQDMRKVLQYLRPVTRPLLKPTEDLGNYMDIFYKDGSSSGVQITFDIR